MIDRHCVQSAELHHHPGGDVPVGPYLTCLWREELGPEDVRGGESPVSLVNDAISILHMV